VPARSATLQGYAAAELGHETGWRPQERMASGKTTLQISLLK